MNRKIWFKPFVMAYKVIYEVPAGYARHILMHTFGTSENPASAERFPDPDRKPLAR